MNRSFLVGGVAALLLGWAAQSSALPRSDSGRCASLQTKVQTCSALKRHLSKHRRRRCSRRLKAYQRRCRINESQPAETVCYLLYQPVCGQPPYYCPPDFICTLNMPAPATYSNACFMEAAGAYLLYDGECREPHDG